MDFKKPGDSIDFRKKYENSNKWYTIQISLCLSQISLICKLSQQTLKNSYKIQKVIQFNQLSVVCFVSTMVKYL